MRNKLPENGSYHQDLFDKMVIMSGDKWKMRMHFFDPDIFYEKNEEVHSHRFHFVSTCLHGGLTQGIWEQGDEWDGIKHYKYVYNPYTTDKGERMFRLEKRGEVYLEQTKTIKVSKDETYYMHPSILHNVTAIEGKSVTLILNKIATHTSCLASETPWEDEEFMRPRMSVESIIGRINELQRLL